MASATTDFLGLIVFPDISGVYQRELRIALVTGEHGNDSNMHIIDAAVKSLSDQISALASVASSGSYNDLTDKPDVYTKAEVDQMMSEMSEILISSADRTSLYSSVNTLMGEDTQFDTLGAGVNAINDQAEELLS